MMAIRDDGQVIGRCRAAALRMTDAKVKDGKLAARLPESVRYGVSGRSGEPVYPVPAAARWRWCWSR